MGESPRSVDHLQVQEWVNENVDNFNGSCHDLRDICVLLSRLVVLLAGALLL